jgi:HYR domain
VSEHGADSFNADPAPSLACVPASGATFPVGVTQVMCVATDHAGNSSSVSFDVTVLGALEQLALLCDDLQSIVDAGPGSSLADKIEDALAACQAGLIKLAVAPPDRQSTAGAIEGAIGDVDAAVSAGLSTARGTQLMTGLCGVGRLLAQTAIDEATLRGASSEKIGEAMKLRDEGDAKRAASDYKDAAAKYKDALAKAESA